MVKKILSIFTTSLLMSGSCYADPGDKVIIQLLLDDRDVHSVHSKIDKYYWKESNEITHPHISLIEVDDKDNLIRNNYSNFIERISQLLKKKNDESQLEFIGKGIEKSDTNFWYLKEADQTSEYSKNRLLKEVGNAVKKTIEDIIKEMQKSKFTLKKPEEIASVLSKNEKIMSESLVKFSNGFPHVSLAKGGKCLSDSFHKIESKPMYFDIVGANFIYSYNHYESNNEIPQIYIRKIFDEKGYHFDSKFNFLHSIDSYYINIDTLIKDINSTNIAGEIQKRTVPTQVPVAERKTVRAKRNIMQELNKGDSFLDSSTREKPKIGDYAAEMTHLRTQFENKKQTQEALRGNMLEKLNLKEEGPSLSPYMGVEEPAVEEMAVENKSQPIVEKMNVASDEEMQLTDRLYLLEQEQFVRELSRAWKR